MKTAYCLIHLPTGITVPTLAQLRQLGATSKTLDFSALPPETKWSTRFYLIRKNARIALTSFMRQQNMGGFTSTVELFEIRKVQVSEKAYSDILQYADRSTSYETNRRHAEKIKQELTAAVSQQPTSPFEW